MPEQPARVPLSQVVEGGVFRFNHMYFRRTSRTCRDNHCANPGVYVECFCVHDGERFLRMPKAVEIRDTRLVEPCMLPEGEPKPQTHD